MFSNLLLGLTGLIYFVLILFNLAPPRGTGDQNVGGLTSGLYVIMAYLVLSLILTVIITAKGGFNWISNATLWRNIGVGVLWLSMVGSVVLCTFFRAECNMGNKATGLVRVFAFLIYFGGIWLPLLMLLPYLSILNPEWRFALSPQLIKIPLLLACALGLILIPANRKVSKLIASDSDESNFNKAMNEIDKEASMSRLFYLATNTHDEQLRNAIFTKIKKSDNLEDELIKVLEDNNQFVFMAVYDFLDINKIEHPERFIAPINLNLDKINFLIEGVTRASWKEVADMEEIKIEPIYRVMRKYFKGNREPFRKSMLAILKTLESPNKRNGGDDETKQFIICLNKYKLDVQNWLD